MRDLLLATEKLSYFWFSLSISVEILALNSNNHFALLFSNCHHIYALNHSSDLKFELHFLHFSSIFFLNIN